MTTNGDVRAVLQYVPQFRSRVIVVLIDAGLLPEPAVAESLLDLAALESIGVHLVLGVLGGDLKDLHDWTLECEIKAAQLSAPIGDPAAIPEAKSIHERGQTVIADASGHAALDPAIVDFTLGMGAVKLITLLNEAILLDGQPIPAIRASEVESLTTSHQIQGSELLHAAAIACQRGVPRIHVLNGHRQGVLVDELFSNEGVGTMVHADAYKQIRPLREEDIPELLGMIGRSVRRSKLVPRTYEDILAKIDDYHVLTLDENVVGCVALHEYPGHPSAELACLYVKLSHESCGYGQELAAHAETIAQQRGIAAIFALSNRAANFFLHQLHYHEGDLDNLPAPRRQQLDASGRDSRVFIKSMIA